MSTKIEWTNQTWNPVVGCTKYSEGCINCYAEKMHKRLSAMGHKKYKFPFNNVLFHYDELNKHFGQKRKMIFVNSMSDLFHQRISLEQISKVLEVCKNNQQHIFQILTKRPERLSAFSYPPNVWLGVTVEHPKYKNRIEYLKNTNAKIKFLSCEPLLADLGELDLRGIDWVIAGGESGSKARPMHPDWIRNIQKQCREQNIPFFFKQWGEWVIAKQKPPFKIENPIYSKLSSKIMLNNGIIIDGIFPNDVKKWEKQTGSSIDNKNAVIILKAGKAKSGALLDGKEYKEFPVIIEAE
ncbi:TPA: phage Gp37/Gp68 family protein [Candidatus Avigastranaerophilus faecigallinarum]|nr:phage Gp37/Gp68 family protein [Candidatus Avigastranaerophilus faecigallinarum]